MTRKTIFQTIMVATVLFWVPMAMAICPAPDPIVRIHNVEASYNEGNDLPLEINAQITNVSYLDRNFQFSVHVHGYFIASVQTGSLSPGETYNYVYNGPHEDWMWDGFKHRVTVTAPQTTAFVARNPARMDAVLEMPAPDGNGSIEIEFIKAEYMGEYQVEIETTLTNVSGSSFSPYWAVVLHGTVDLRDGEPVDLAPGETATYHQTIDLSTIEGMEFVDGWGPYPLRVMSCSMGFCKAAFFAPDDLCQCETEICDNGVDDDCNGVSDVNEDRCSSVETIVRGLEWQTTGHFGQFNNTNAVDYCTSLAGDGWRLPTKDELKSLVVCTNEIDTPLADGATCEGESNYQWPTIAEYFTSSLGNYRTSTQDGEDFWMVNFYSGEAEPLSPSSTGNVRCVRSIGF